MESEKLSRAGSGGLSKRRDSSGGRSSATVDDQEESGGKVWNAESGDCIPVYVGGTS